MGGREVSHSCSGYNMSKRGGGRGVQTRQLMKDMLHMLTFFYWCLGFFLLSRVPCLLGLTLKLTSPTVNAVDNAWISQNGKRITKNDVSVANVMSIYLSTPLRLSLSLTNHSLAIIPSLLFLAGEYENMKPKSDVQYVRTGLIFFYPYAHWFKIKQDALPLSIWKSFWIKVSAKWLHHYPSLTNLCDLGLWASLPSK